MHKLRKILLTIFIASLFTILVGNVSYARVHEESLPAQAGLEQKRQERQDTKEQRELDRAARRCEQVGTRIANRLSRYEENRDNHVTRFDKFVERLDEILVKLTDAGKDTAILSEHVGAIKAMIDEYIAAYDTFIASLLAVEGIVCGDSEGEYHISLKVAREQLRAAWKKRQEIRKYYAEVIRKDIADLRGDSAEKSEVEETTESEDE